MTTRVPKTNSTGTYRQHCARLSWRGSWCPPSVSRGFPCSWRRASCAAGSRRRASREPGPSSQRPAALRPSLLACPVSFPTSARSWDGAADRAPDLRAVAVGRLVGLQASHQLIIGRRLQDVVELCPVVEHEADSLHEDVVDEPAIALVEKAIVDGHLRRLLGHDLRVHRSHVALDRLPHIVDLLAAVLLDLADIGALEEIGEELHELLLLILVELLPVPAEGAPRHLGEVEDRVGVVPDRRPPLRGLGLRPKTRILQDGEDVIDRDAELIGRKARRCRAGASKEQRAEGDDLEPPEHQAPRMWMFTVRQRGPSHSASRIACSSSRASAPSVMPMATPCPSRLARRCAAALPRSQSDHRTSLCR